MQRWNSNLALSCLGEGHAAILATNAASSSEHSHDLWGFHPVPKWSLHDPGQNHLFQVVSLTEKSHQRQEDQLHAELVFLHYQDQVSAILDDYRSHDEGGG